MYLQVLYFNLENAFYDMPFDLYFSVRITAESQLWLRVQSSFF